MARQVFYVLVGLLRGERSFLDPQIWNPARYQFWRSAADYDDLDLFYRPLYCQAAMPFCNRTRRTSVTPWTNRSSSLADLKKWLTLSSSCATFSIGASICEKISLNEDRDGGSEPQTLKLCGYPSHCGLRCMILCASPRQSEILWQAVLSRANFRAVSLASVKEFCGQRNDPIGCIRPSTVFLLERLVKLASTERSPSKSTIRGIDDANGGVELQFDIL